MSGDAERLSDFKVFTIQRYTKFYNETHSFEHTDLVEHVSGYVTREAIIDVYPKFDQSKYSEYIIIEKQSTKNVFTSQDGFGNLILREVMVEGFIPCMYNITLFNIIFFNKLTLDKSIGDDKLIKYIQKSIQGNEFYIKNPIIEPKSNFNCLGELNKKSNKIIIDLQKLYILKHIAIFNSDLYLLKNFKIFFEKTKPDSQNSHENKETNIFISSKNIPKNGIFSEYFEDKNDPLNNHIGRYLIIESSLNMQICQIRIDGKLHGFWNLMISDFNIF